MITQPPAGLVDETLRRLRGSGQMPVALATGPAGFAIGSNPARMPAGLKEAYGPVNAGAPPAGPRPFTLGEETGIRAPGTRQNLMDLLGESNEIKLQRDPDTGSVTEMRKIVHPPGSGGQSTDDGRPPAGMVEHFRQNPMTGEMVKGPLLDTGKAPAGLADLLRPTATDPFPARSITNEMSSTHERRQLLQRQGIDDQLRREGMASGERVAKSQADAIAAREQIRMDTALGKAQIGADARTDVATVNAEAKRYDSDNRLKSAQELARLKGVEIQNWKDASENKLQTEENKNQIKYELEMMKPGQGVILSNGHRYTKVGNSLLNLDTMQIEARGGSQLVDDLSTAGLVKVGQPGAAQTPSTGTPAPAPGAGMVTMQFPDGKRKQVATSQQDQYIALGGKII